jgi:hypothetical protein
MLQFCKAMEELESAEIDRILNDPRRDGDGTIARRAEKFMKKGGA